MAIDFNKIHLQSVYTMPVSLWSFKRDVSKTKLRYKGKDDLLNHESLHQSHEIMVHFESAVPPNLQS